MLSVPERISGQTGSVAEGSSTLVTVRVGSCKPAPPPPPPKKIIGPVPWLGWKRVVVQLGTEHVYCGLELIGQHFTVALNFTFVRACVCGRTDVHTCASVALTAARLLPEQCADRRRLFWRSVSQPLEAHGFSPPSSPVLGGLYSFFSF